MNKFFEMIFPMVANYRINEALRKKLAAFDESGGQQENHGILSNIENSDKISTQILKEQYDNTLRTKDKLEDKAKANIISITISITLIMGASNVLQVVAEKYSQAFLSWSGFTLFICAVIYMFFGGILAIKVLISENEVYVIGLKNFASDESTLREAYDISIAQNITKNQIRNNYIYTSYECIRNALMCLFFVLVLSALPLEMHASNADTDFFKYSQSQCDYTFMFSSDAITNLNDDSVYDVENAIIQALNKNPEVINEPAIGIIDSSHNLYIKFIVHERDVDVLLVEPYIIPQEVVSQ